MMSFELEKIDPRTANEQNMQAVHQLMNSLRAERLPDDPPISLAELQVRFKSIPPIVTAQMWLVRQEGETAVIGRGELITLQTEENQHLGNMAIEVLPEYRQQGVARLLLLSIVAAADKAGRRLLIADTNGRVPAGAAFMKRIGAAKGLETHTNQLMLATMDRSLVADWLQRAQALTADFELGLWDGPYPEAQIDEIVELLTIINDQPMGELEVEDFHWTPEQIRQIEQMTFAGGRERWTFYVREKATGNLAGYTEVTWNPNRPEHLQQGVTGVFPKYRNRGLGRWLKAAMLQKIVSDRPQVNFVRTGNADANAPMLKINQELGFQPYLSETVWQLELTAARQYLRESAGEITGIAAAAAE